MRTGRGGPHARRVSTGGHASSATDGSAQSPPAPDPRSSESATSRQRVGVVLAAGRSQRLSKLTNGTSKALVQLGGVPLVERAVRTLLRAGCTRVVVVVGHQGRRVAGAAM